MRGDVGGATQEDVVIRFLCMYQLIALRVVLPGLCPAGLSVHPETNEDDFKGQSGLKLKSRCRGTKWDGTLWFLALWRLPLPHVRGGSRVQIEQHV